MTVQEALRKSCQWCRNPMTLDVVHGHTFYQCQTCDRRPAGFSSKCDEPECTICGDVPS